MGPAAGHFRERHAAPEPHADDPDAASHTIANREVSMRGDLQQIPLEDIFQTLGISKMEGVLSIAHQGGQRSLYFHDARVKDLVFGRLKHRRLGQRLVRAGLLDPPQLRAVLKRQADEKRPLGAILVDEGLVTREQIEEIACYEAAEDLYALFTWREGTFAFYKGTPADARTTERIKAVPEFDINGVLLEVARRADEWERILAALHSVDEILLRSDGRDPEQLDEDQSVVLRAIDGTLTMRELTEATPLGLFDCARVCRELHEAGLVELAQPEELLAFAEMQRLHGNVKRALTTLRTLQRRTEPLDLTTTRELAAALHRCGDSALGGRVLWLHARACDDDALALQMAREACAIDSRSPYLLEYLRELLERSGGAGTELCAATQGLAEALVGEGRLEEALAALERLESMGDDPARVLTKKAQLLEQLSRTDEAADELLRLAEMLEKQRRYDQLARVYQRVLMLDSKRREAAKALSALRTTARTRRVRRAATAAVALAACMAGILAWRHHATTQRVAAVAEAFAGRLTTAPLPELSAEIDRAEAELGVHAALAELRDRLHAERERRDAERRRELRVAASARLAEAEGRLAEGDLLDVLQTYREVLETADDPELSELVRQRLGQLVERTETLASELPRRLPDAPRAETGEAARQAALAELDRAFDPAQLRRARSLQSAQAGPILAALLGRPAKERLVASAAAVEQSFAAAERRRDEYRELERRAGAAARAEALLAAAREHEAKRAFGDAARAYRSLADDGLVDAATAEKYRAEAERWESVARTLEQLAAATAAQDHGRAAALLDALVAREPEAGFDTFAALPLRIETVPPGALAAIDDVIAGPTPVRSTYLRGQQQTVRLTLEGFQPIAIPIGADCDGTIRTALVRKHDWSQLFLGSVQRQPLCTEDGAAIVVDRSGAITALRLDDGHQLWRVRTDDLSGLLTRPVAFGTRVVVASFDGRVRCLDRASGAVVWERDGLRCEGTPVLAGGVLVFGTRDGEVVGLDPEAGAEQWRSGVPGEVHADLAAGARAAFAVTGNGWLVCVDASRGAVTWKQRVGTASSAPPVVGQDRVLAASRDGTLFAFAAADGSVLWQRPGLGEPALAPCIAGKRVLVVSGRKLLSLALEDGERGPAFEGEREISCAPVVTPQAVYVGDHGGILTVLDPATLAVRYTLRGTGPLLAPVAVDTAGHAIAAFDSKLVLGFRELP